MNKEKQRERCRQYYLSHKDELNVKYKARWHIDHIKPCAKFELTNKEEQLKCFHYTNLQPLWALDNIKKGDNYAS